MIGYVSLYYFAWLLICWFALLSVIFYVPSTWIPFLCQTFTSRFLDHGVLVHRDVLEIGGIIIAIVRVCDFFVIFFFYSFHLALCGSRWLILVLYTRFRHLALAFPLFAFLEWNWKTVFHHSSWQNSSNGDFTQIFLFDLFNRDVQLDATVILYPLTSSPLRNIVISAYSITWTKSLLWRMQTCWLKYWSSSSSIN